MKKMPHLSKWSNEFAGYDHYTFFFNSQNVSLRPAHSSHTLFSQSSDRHPVKLSHSNFYFNILGQGVKKYQVSSLLVFYDTSWKTEAWPFLSFEEHSNNFPKINLLSTAPKIKMLKLQQNHHSSPWT